MKILQMTSARYLGGGERHVVDLSRALVNRGHYIFAAISPAAAIRAELSFIPAKRIAELPLRNSIDLPAAMRLARFAKENSAELIHAHVARDYTIAAVAARVAGIPFVITRHVIFPMSRIHSLFLRDVRFVIAPSRAVATSLGSQGIFPMHKIVTVRHGLDAGAYTVQERGGQNEFVIGSVGNLDAVKGFDILIHAAEMVANKLPSSRFEIVGEDRSRDRRTERELSELISSANLTGRVRLMGASSDICRTLDGFDIFVSTSRSESFGYAIAEAMMSGIPVIASETEGAAEIVGDGGAGVLVPIGSVSALADAIVALADDEPRRNALARAGRDRILKEFSLGRMTEETEDVYRRAVAAR